MNIGNRRMTRLNYEFKSYLKEQDNCNKDGIYLFQSSIKEDVFYGFVIGPSDTPYQNAYFLFRMEFPDMYPFHPPKMKFISLDQSCRIHPNLYHDGYVCLSMINTWGENEYSPGLSLIKILRTVQSILTENPIEAEPQHENDKSLEAINYREMVRYDVLDLYQYQMVLDQTLPQNTQKIPLDICNQIAPILKDLYLKNFAVSMEIIEKNINSQYNNFSSRASVYSFYQRTLQYNYLATKFKDLYDLLSK